MGGLGLPQRIFRPEPNNVYEEPAVVSYWACRSLLAAMAAAAAAPAESHQQDAGWWVEGSGVAAELQALLEPLVRVDVDVDVGSSPLLRRALEGSAWVGGLTNHPEVLPRLFAALLAALLLVVLGSEGKEEGNVVVAQMVAAAAGGLESEWAAPHMLIRWALQSLETAVAVAADGGVEMGLGLRARQVVGCINWSVVEGYGPFARPELPVVEEE